MAAILIVFNSRFNLLYFMAVVFVFGITGCQTDSREKFVVAVDSVDGTDSNVGHLHDSDHDGDGVSFDFHKSVSDSIGTVGVVEWVVNVDFKISRAYVEFGLTEDYGEIAPARKRGSGFKALLLGLKGNMKYHFQIVVEAGDQKFRSIDSTIVSGPAANIPAPIVKVHQPDKLADGYCVMSTFSAPSFARKPMAFILDSDGDLVWWYETEALTDSTKACMSYSGDYLAIVSSNNRGNSGAVEIVSMDQQDVRVFKRLEGASHDITPVPGNKFAYLRFVPDGSIVMTHKCAKVIELSLDGSVEEIFDTAVVWGDNCHGNALRYSEAEGLYTVSDHQHSEIAAFSRDGKIAWVTQNDGIWEYQHGHHLLDDSLLIFSNGANYSSGELQSYVFEFEFSDANGGLNEIWRYSVDRLGTPTLGDVQRLPNGNTMVAYSNKAVIHEVDSDGSLVQELDLGKTAFGYVVWRSSLYGPPDDLTL